MKLSQPPEAKRLLAIELARTMAVRAACEAAGISTSQYYRFLPRYLAEGDDGLCDRDKRRPRHIHPATKSEEVRRLVVQEALKFPQFGTRKLQSHLKGFQVQVSESTLRNILGERGFTTRARRIRKRAETDFTGENTAQPIDSLTFPLAEAREPGNVIWLYVIAYGDTLERNRINIHFAIDACTMRAWGLATHGPPNAGNARLLRDNVTPELAKENRSSRKGRKCIIREVQCDDGPEFRGEIERAVPAETADHESKNRMLWIITTTVINCHTPRDRRERIRHHLRVDEAIGAKEREDLTRALALPDRKFYVWLDDQRFNTETRGIPLFRNNAESDKLSKTRFFVNYLLDHRIDYRPVPGRSYAINEYTQWFHGSAVRGVLAEIYALLQTEPSHDLARIQTMLNSWLGKYNSEISSLENRNIENLRQSNVRY